MGHFKGVAEQVFAAADKLFEERKLHKLVKLLKKQKNWKKNEQILWRLARCELYMSITDDEMVEELVTNAYEHVKKSLELDDKNGLAHFLASSLLLMASKPRSPREFFEVINGMREHMEKAIQYSPDNPYIYLNLGNWHYSFRFNYSCLDRVIASIQSVELPEGDLEEALRLFEKAEEVCKDFDPNNKLMMAKTLLKLKREKSRARRLLDEVLSKCSGSESWEDKETFMEAYILFVTL